MGFDRLFRLLFLCWLGLAALLAQAQAPLRIGTLDIPPFGLRSETGQAEGAFYGLGQRIAALAQEAPDNQLLPTARLYALLQRRQLDLAISSRSLDRDMGLIRLGQVWQFEGVIVYHKDSRLAPRQLNDFSGKQLGRLKDSCPAVARVPGVRIYELSEYGQGLRMLVAKRLDGLCAERYGLLYAARDEPEALFTMAEPFPFLTTPVWVFANPKLDPQRIERLRQAVVQVQREGEMEKQMAPYLPKRIYGSQ
ncbi:substrate-binding periplasmic protein [Chitinimonas lacunae]|uniref:Substrate-binding periplasmic protein n=1 Tax=Chitinimonas lacunae TaxID=1963018 RepID=A0ABV8MS42_9NEIS